MFTNCHEFLIFEAEAFALFHETPWFSQTSCSLTSFRFYSTETTETSEVTLKKNIEFLLGHEKIGAVQYLISKSNKNYKSTQALP